MRCMVLMVWLSQTVITTGDGNSKHEANTSQWVLLEQSWNIVATVPAPGTTTGMVLRNLTNARTSKTGFVNALTAKQLCKTL